MPWELILGSIGLVAFVIFGWLYYFSTITEEYLDDNEE